MEKMTYWSWVGEECDGSQDLGTSHVMSAHVGSDNFPQDGSEESFT